MNCRRLLLQNNNALNISTFIASNNPSQTSTAYNNAVNDGQLASALQAIGLTVSGTPTMGTVSFMQITSSAYIHALYSMGAC